MNTYMIETIVCGYQVIWKAAVRQVLHWQWEHSWSLIHCCHVPRAISSVCYLFLGKCGTILYQITGEVANWCYHTVLRSPFSDFIGSEALYAWMSECQAFPSMLQACLMLVSLLCWRLQHSKKVHLSKGDQQALVAIALSESIWNKNMLNGRSIKERTPWVCMRQKVSAVSYPFHVCHAPKKFTEKTFVALHKSAKFSPTIVSHYTVLIWIQPDNMLSSQSHSWKAWLHHIKF